MMETAHSGSGFYINQVGFDPIISVIEEIS